MENRNILTETLEDEIDRFDFINMDCLTEKSQQKNEFVLTSQEMEQLQEKHEQFEEENEFLRNKVEQLEKGNNSIMGIENYYKNQMLEWDEKFRDQNQKINTYEEKITDFEAQIDLLEKNTKILNEEKYESEQKFNIIIQELHQEIASEKKRNLGIKSKNQIMEKQMDEIESQLNELKSKNKDLNSKIKTQGDTIDILTQKISDNEEQHLSKIVQIHQEYYQSENSLKQEISELQDQVNQQLDIMEDLRAFQEQETEGLLQEISKLKQEHFQQVQFLLKSKGPGDQSNRIEIDEHSDNDIHIETDLFDTNPSIIQNVGVDEYLSMNDCARSSSDRNSYPYLSNKISPKKGGGSEPSVEELSEENFKVPQLNLTKIVAPRDSKKNIFSKRAKQGKISDDTLTSHHLKKSFLPKTKREPDLVFTQEETELLKFKFEELSQKITQLFRNCSPGQEVPYVENIGSLLDLVDVTLINQQKFLKMAMDQLRRQQWTNMEIKKSLEEKTAQNKILVDKIQRFEKTIQMKIKKKLEKKSLFSLQDDNKLVSLYNSIKQKHENNSFFD